LDPDLQRYSLNRLHLSLDARIHPVDGFHSTLRVGELSSATLGR
jgi:hypothetical protein